MGIMREYGSDETGSVLDDVTRYLKALSEYELERPQWEIEASRLSKLPDKDHRDFGATVVASKFDGLLFGFRNRPVEAGLFEKEEVDIWISALTLPWRLWPDSMTGHLMVLDYISEKASLSDLDKVIAGPGVVAIIKQIAQTTRWPNNPLCGDMTGNAAKSILARSSRSVSFAEATTVPLVRALSGLSTAPQPRRSAESARRRGLGYWGTAADLRRVCDNDLCREVEAGTKFERCKKCKASFYCSRDCQRVAWKAGHKSVCVVASHMICDISNP